MRAKDACTHHNSFCWSFLLQVWFRVNDLLPDGLQKSLPDRPPEMPQHSTDVLTGEDIELSVVKVLVDFNVKIIILHVPEHHIFERQILFNF